MCNLLDFIEKRSLIRNMTLKLPHLHEYGRYTTLKDELFLGYKPV